MVPVKFILLEEWDLMYSVSGEASLCQNQKIS